MARIQTVVLPAAGLGTRLLPYTKEIPKEMLPLIVKEHEEIVVKPVLHYIFDELYNIGFRKFYFVVGRGKRVIEDYFTPDWNYVDYLIKIGKEKLARLLEEFYKRIERCDIIMVNQPWPRGFGDAVLRTKPFMTEDVFLVHAGDDVIYPNHADNIKMLIDHFEKYKPGVALLYDKSTTPERYGVIIGEDKGNYLLVRDVIEKPKRPPTRDVVVAVYVFDKIIYDALEATKPERGEHQLTDAIRYLIKSGIEVHALKVRGHRLDLGTPDLYFNALQVMVSETSRA